MAWGDVPRGLYRREWEAKKGGMSTLDYCGWVLSTKRGALFIECGCQNALSGRRKIAQRAPNDKVIVLRWTKLRNFILRTRVNMTQPPPKIRIVSTAFGTVEDLTILIAPRPKMPGAQPDLSAATYQIHNETHTLGNALRWMLMKKY
jgi:hypothetical protein